MHEGLMTVFMWPVGLDTRKLTEVCTDCGLTAEITEMRGGDEDQELEKRMELLKTLVASAACTAPLMLEVHPKLQFLIGSALQFISGRHFCRSALRELRSGFFGMDLLVSLSSALIYGYSSYVALTRKSNFKLYFTSGGVLLSLILFGKYMEQAATGEASSAIRKLMRLQPRTAMVKRGDKFEETSVDKIRLGDIVLIRPGERIPADGIIVGGSCAVDESMLTGESLPVDKSEKDKLIGVLGIADTLKPEAAEAVRQFKGAGKEVWMLTGDNERTARVIAAKAGIDNVLFEVRPGEKAAQIERLKAMGKTVCMVGDGINDTPALASADCAVAMGTGSDIAIEAAGVLLPSGDLRKLPMAFGISSATMKTIRQNLRWALFYNIISIPVAAMGILHPSICAAAMSASSIGVLMHSLRLKNPDKKRTAKWKKK